MSLIEAAIREALCDWPGCQKPFNDTIGANVALVHNGEINAFCAEHSDRVTSDGITLRSLVEIHAEAKAPIQAAELQRRQQHQVDVEADALEAWKRG